MTSRRCTVSGIARRSIAILLLSFFVFSCGQEKKATATAKRVKVRYNVTQSMSFAVLAIARDRGYFADEGIDAVPIALDPNSSMLALVKGGLDVASAPVRSGIFNMIARGQPIRVVADKGHIGSGTCPSEAFIAPTAMAERIARAGGNLRGERIGAVPGGLMEFLVDRLLEQRQIDRSSVEIVPIPQGEQYMNFQRQHPLDALSYIAEPMLSAALARGDSRIVVTPEEIAAGLPKHVLMYGKRLLHDDPDLGRRFMRAYLRGIHDYNLGKTEANVALLSQYTRLPPDVLRRACWPPIANDAKVDPASMQPFLTWARKHGYLEKDLSPSLWWDPSFADAAAGGGKPR